MNPTPHSPELAVEALAEYAAFIDANPRLHFDPHPWQRKFIRAHGQFRECMACAGNRTGKTLMAAFMDACHATGDYPPWWDGYRFSHAPSIWCLGVTSEQLAQVLQRLLFGELTDQGFSGGFVRQDEIIEVTRNPSSPRLAREVVVRHVTGRRATVNLRAYTQSSTGQQTLSFAGVSIDLIHVDEQPPDDVMAQLATRLMTGDRGRGGRLICTMTPELGLSPYLREFMASKAAHRYFQRVSWDECPHLSPQVQEELLASIPAWQHDLRKRGVPVLGSGLVYAVDEKRITCDPFPIPRHYRVLRAFDIGYGHPTAVVWLAHDPDRDVIYLVNEYRVAGETPPIHAAAANAMWRGAPVVMPKDADQTEKGSGKTMWDHYYNAGLMELVEFSNADGSNYIEPGIAELYERMRTDRFKIFSTCPLTLGEVRAYHRDQKTGKVVASDDDLVSALRYGAVMIPRYGVPLHAIGQPNVAPVTGRFGLAHRERRR